MLVSASHAVWAVDGPYNLGSLGAMGELYPPKSPQQITLPERYDAIKIISIIKDTPAEKSGLVVGDIIAGVDAPKFPPKSNPVHILLDTLEKASLKKGSSIKLQVLRNNKPLTVKVEVEYLGSHAKTCPEDCPRCAKLIKESLDCIARHPVEKGEVPPHVVIVALRGLAFLASGSTPVSGTYASNIKQCIDFIIWYFDTINPDTMFINWALGYAALFLGEVYHKNPTPEVKRILQKIARLIINNQEPNGGWGHGPLGGTGPSGYKDLLAASCYCLAGLGIIKRLGIDTQIPESTMARGLEYINKCKGAYLLGNTGYPHGRCARMAHSIFVLALLGQQEKYRSVYLEMVKYFTQHLIEVPNAHDSNMVGMLSGAFACSYLEPQVWRQYINTLLLFEILGHRRPDGPFAARPDVMAHNYDRDYGGDTIAWPTAGYLIILQLPKGHLKLITGMK